MYKNDNQNGLNPERLFNEKAEANEIIRRLKAEPKYCQEFFYGKKNTECPIAPLRSNVLGYLAQNYQVVMSNEDFGTILYQTLWSEGTWTALKSYDDSSPFFVWLKKVAKNAVLGRLAEERIIPSSRKRTPGNTRLALLSQSVEKCQLIIDEQLSGNKYHALMSAVYVSRLTKEEIMNQYSMTEQAYIDARNEGEYTLKEALLRSTSGYEEEVLRDKTSNYQNVSLEFGDDMEEWMRTESTENSLKDVFGVNLTDEEIYEKVVALLYSLSSNMDWNDRDRLLWRQRFVHDTPPVKLASIFGRTRAWVDTRYSQLNKEMKQPLKRWWQTNAA